MDLPTFNVLSLCTGAGGLDLGLSLAVPSTRVVCCVEHEAYACEVLAYRMEEKTLDAAPVWTDLRTFDGRPWRGVVDCVTGGYPCQPFSVAGRKRGEDDPRHLWPHVARIVREVRPAFTFFENVSNHLNIGYRDVRRELEEMGYRVAEGLFTAEEVGATLEPAICGMAHGMADRVGRLRLCGNGVVPLAAAYAFRTLAVDLLTEGDDG